MKYESAILKSKETIEIFSPLANKLNILRMKIELDDLSIKFIVDNGIN